MKKNVLVLICSLRAKSSQNRTAALAETGPRLVLNLAYVLLQMNSPFRVWIYIQSIYHTRTHLKVMNDAFQTRGA